jgi:3-hydroxybutyryl-CoA dehydrogenase
MAEIHRVAVIGAGHRGRAIAYAAALAGYPTILEDLLPASLRAAESELRDLVEQKVKQGTLTQHEAEAAVARLEYARTVEQAARVADLVIEAVPDEMESKLEIFTLLDKICAPRTMLALNSATLDVSEIATATYRQPRCIGLRFDEGMNRVEVARGRETDDETLAAVLAVARRMCPEVTVRHETSPVQPSAGP